VTKTAFRDVAKEALDHIEPGSTGGREVSMEMFVSLGVLRLIRFQNRIHS
jgi:hypothetical protein